MILELSISIIQPILLAWDHVGTLAVPFNIRGCALNRQNTIDTFSALILGMKKGIFINHVAFFVSAKNIKMLKESQMGVLWMPGNKGTQGQRSSTQGSPGQRSSTQGSQGQRSSTQGSPGQRSSTQGSQGQRSSTQGSPGQRSSTQGSQGHREKKNKDEANKKDSSEAKDKDSASNSKKTSPKNILKNSKAKSINEAMKKPNFTDSIEGAADPAIKDKNRASKSTGPKRGRPGIESGPVENSPSIPKAGKEVTKGKTEMGINNKEKEGVLSTRDLNNSTTVRKNATREINNNITVEKDVSKATAVQPTESRKQVKQVKNTEMLSDKDLSNDSEFVCTFCELRLSTDRQLANHYLTSHSGRYTLLTCSICEAQVAKCKTSFGLVWRPDVGYYTTNKALNAHISLAHPSERASSALASDAKKGDGLLASSAKGFRQPVAKKRTGGTPLVGPSKKARKSLDADPKKGSSPLAIPEKKGRSSLDNMGKKTASFYKTLKDYV